MIDITPIRERINRATNKLKLAAIGCTLGTITPNIRAEAEEAENDLIAFVYTIEQKRQRAESELAHLRSGWYNRIRTWVGCAFARHYAQLEDISFILSHPIAKEL